MYGSRVRAPEGSLRKPPLNRGGFFLLSGNYNWKNFRVINVSLYIWIVLITYYVTFRPDQVQIISKGEDYAGHYHSSGIRLEVELRFSEQGRARIIVRNPDDVVEDTEIRLPTTASLPLRIQANALIFSAVERHVEKTLSGDS